MVIGILCPWIKPVCGRSQMVVSLVRSLSANGHRVILFSNSVEISIEGIKDLIFVPIAADPFNKKFVAAASSIFKILKAADKYEIQILHAHHRYYEIIGLAAAQLIRIPSIMTIHSAALNHRIISYRSKKLVVVSGSLKKQIERNFRRRKVNIEKIYNGVNLPERNSERSGRKRIICVGNFTPLKNFRLVLDAVAISSLRNKISLRFIGKGELEAEYKKLAAEAKIDLVIMEYPSIPWEEYFTSDLLVAPSKEETFGMTLIEAGAAALPVIASNISGHTEIITDRFDGLLFKTDSAEDLIQKIETLLNNPQLAEKYGQRLREKVSKKFNADRTALEYIELYHRLLN